MHSFAASELQRNSAQVQKAALMGPVFLTYHDKTRYVMMSLEEYIRIQRNTVAVHVPETPNIDASAVDKLVLATINAPYKRSIDAMTLSACLVKPDIDQWLVHIVTFFTDVAPDLVFKFADQHGISKSKLAKAYLAIKKKTGEQNLVLEANLVPMASSSRSNYRRSGSSSKKGKSHP